MSSWWAKLVQGDGVHFLAALPCFLLPASFLMVSLSREGPQPSRPASSFFRWKNPRPTEVFESHFLFQKLGSYQFLFSLFTTYCRKERKGRPTREKKTKPKKTPRNQKFYFVDTKLSLLISNFPSSMTVCLESSSIKGPERSALHHSQTLVWVISQAADQGWR